MDRSMTEHREDTGEKKSLNFIETMVEEDLRSGLHHNELSLLMARAALEQDVPLRELDVAAAERAARLTQTLLDFSRTGSLRSTVVDVHGLIDEADVLGVLISWGESLLAAGQAKSYDKDRRGDIKFALDLFAVINTGGGGGVDE